MNLLLPTFINNNNYTHTFRIMASSCFVSLYLLLILLLLMAILVQNDKFFNGFYYYSRIHFIFHVQYIHKNTLF